MRAADSNGFKIAVPEIKYRDTRDSAARSRTPASISGAIASLTPGGSSRANSGDAGDVGKHAIAIFLEVMDQAAQSVGVGAVSADRRSQLRDFREMTQRTPAGIRDRRPRPLVEEAIDHDRAELETLGVHLRQQLARLRDAIRLGRRDHHEFHRRGMQQRFSLLQAIDDPVHAVGHRGEKIRDGREHGAPAKRSSSRTTKRAASLATLIAIRPAESDGVNSHRAVRESSNRISRAGVCRNSNECDAGGVSTTSSSKAPA